MNVNVLNLISCIVIVVLGICSYMVSKSPVSLYITAAFFLFGISHYMTLIGRYEKLGWVVDIVRICGFLSIILVLSAFIWIR